MLHRALALAVLALFLLCPRAALAQQATVSEARLTWYGVYQTRHDTAVEDKSTINGRRVVSTGIAPPAVNSDQIPAVLHTRFGFGFTLSGAPPGGLVSLRVVRKFPPPGLVESRTSARRLSEESEIVLGVDQKDLFIGYLFEEAEELVPGPWSIALWRSDRLLVEKSFTIYRP